MPSNESSTYNVRISEWDGIPIEQFALFGSLRKTLTSNAEWKIQEVRFTEQGKDVIL